MKRIFLWAAALTATTMLTSCEEEDNPAPDNNESRAIELTRTESVLVNGNNDFAFNLFRLLRSETESQILSPISITYALGMLNNGASGETQQQINEVLGFGDTGADGINAFCRKMLTEAPALDKLTKIMISNTIYMNKGYELKPSFIEVAKAYYDAEPETRDFHDGKTADVINQWASDHTEKMIEKVVDDQTFNTDAVSYLLNAIYFKGGWANKFDPSETKEEVFNHAGGTEELTWRPMMHQEHRFMYTDNDLCQALTLPYGNNAYAMTILLPHENKTIDDVIGTLTADSWQQDYLWMSPATVDVKLPRFEIQSNHDLTGAMAALGMPKAFTDSAEFPDFCNVPTLIDQMMQVARIKLNEEGTEAAAVTVITIVPTSYIPDPPHVEFHANRPFLYIISERSTGAIFFIGQYTGY